MHSSRLFVILFGILAGFSLPVDMSAAFAQDTVEIPPLPRPRPDRDTITDAPPAEVNAATEAIAALTDVPQALTLTARITQDGAPITEGLVWRIFDSAPDESGEMALIAKAEGGDAALELKPGDYVVHVAYGQAQVSETLSIAPGENTLDVILDAGALRLNSAVTGDIPISPALLHFDIYTGGTDASRALIADNLPPNEIVTLNAGTYHIVSRFGTINAVVRADLRVEPGQLTDATLYHHAAEVSFKLVSEEGGEAIADVEWTVKTADGATVFSDRGAFPSTVLSEGEYLVLAKLGDQVFNREIEIQPGSPREIELLTSVYSG
jgi:hypothetical protein